MKKLAVFALLSCLPLLAIAMRPDHMRISSAINRAMSQTVRSEYVASQLIFQYHESGNWYNDQKITLHYGSQPTLPDSVRVYEWSADDSNWIHFASTVYQFTTAGRVSSSLTTAFWNGMPMPYMRNFASYNAQNWLTHLNMQIYDFMGSGWTSMIRWHVEYANNNIDLVYVYGYDDDLSQPEFSKIDLIFDAQGRIIEELDQASPDSTNWVNNERVVREYYSGDSSTGLSFIEYLSDFLPTAILDGNLTNLAVIKPASEYFYDWNGSWIPKDRSIYTYNGQHQCLNVVDSYYENGVFHQGYRHEYNYLANGEVGTELSQYWNGGGNFWENDEFITYEWLYVTATDDPSAPQASQLALKLYPSPFKDQLTIDISAKDSTPVQLQVFNLKGQVVKEWNAATRAQTTWDGRDKAGRELPSGVYFLKVLSGKSSVMQKCLKIQ